MPIYHTLKIISVSSKVFVECNTTNFFSPCNLSSNDSDHITNTELWLGRLLLLKSQYIEEENDMCKGELLEFIEALQNE
jgi:hypothetical protein